MSISRVTLTEDPQWSKALCGRSVWTILSKSKHRALGSYTSKGCIGLLSLSAAMP